MIKVSLIVPVYNVEKYLKRCLDSIVNQTLEDIEIICVDDGSTDNSSLILDEYAKKDSRIKIIRQENMGLGYARNKGIECAKGEYLEFVDSDDWIEPETCEFLYNKITELDLDMLMFCAKVYNEDDDEFDLNYGYYNYSSLNDEFWNKIFTYKDVPNPLFMPVSSYLKIYNSEFLKNLGLKFPDNCFEDNYFFFNSFFSAKNVSLIKNQFYVRVIRDDSIMQSKGEKFMDSLIAMDQIIETFKNYGLFDEYEAQLLNRKLELNRLRYFEIHDDLKEEYWKRMKENFMNISNSFKDLTVLEENFLSFYNSVINSNSNTEFLKNLYLELYDRTNKNIKYLNNEINSLKKSNDSLNNEINSLKKSNDSLNKDINELSEFKEDVLSSNSWKMTEPLRSIRNKSNL